MSFQYALRYTLDPKTIDATKVAQLIDFCQQGQIDNVTFFINPEELNQSHLTASETDVWLQAIVPVSQQLAKLGVTTSLNPWTTLMHSDRGQTVNSTIGFRTMVDYQGRKADSIACPGDPSWQHYLVERYRQYATLKPRELWLEDDFRHYNHTPLQLGCFCDYHMQEYAKLLGTVESRTEFVAQMLKPGQPTKERLVYLQVAQQEMIQVAKMLEQAVHGVSPATRLALMTSYPNWHAVEGRDWQQLLTSLAGPGQPIVARPHLPAYNEVSSLQYGRDFEEYSRATAAYLGPTAELFPELENYMYSPYAKSLTFTQFQIETTALLGAKSVLLNLFDMIGNGINPDYHYAEMLAKIKPMLNKVTDNRLRLQTATGIQVLLDQQSSQTIVTTAGQDPAELLPRETSWAALLSQFGFATRLIPVQADLPFKRQTVAISGQLLRNFTNRQIERLLADNTVLLDGEAVAVVLERGLKKVLHIQHAQWCRARTGYQSYEQFDGQTFSHIQNPRMTMLQHTGDYLQINYDAKANVAVKSSAYRSDGQLLGPMETVVDEHLIILPINYDVRHGWEAEYHDFRQQSLQRILTQQDYLIGMPNVKLSIEKKEATKLWISNFSLDGYQQIQWHPGSELVVKKIRVVAASPSVVVPTTIEWQATSSVMTIQVPVPPLATLLIIIES